jgi:hypothetical protein
VGKVCDGNWTSKNGHGTDGKYYIDIYDPDDFVLTQGNGMNMGTNIDRSTVRGTTWCCPKK